MFCTDLRLLFRGHVDILHLFFPCVYSRSFWKDLEFYINRKIEIIIEICTFYIENARHIIHLFIVLGKLQIY